MALLDGPIADCCGVVRIEISNGVEGGRCHRCILGRRDGIGGRGEGMDTIIILSEIGVIKGVFQRFHADPNFSKSYFWALSTKKICSTMPPHCRAQNLDFLARFTRKVQILGSKKLPADML
jgi:hypothetical protein